MRDLEYYLSNNYNLYFVYNYYKLFLKFEYSDQNVIDYINNNKITYKNSRELLIKDPKPQKPIVCFYAVHLQNNDNKLLMHNISQILTSKNIEKLIIVYSSDNNITLKIDNPNVIIKNIENVGYDFNKYYQGILTFLNEAVEHENYYYILLNDSVFINKKLDDIIDFYLNHKHELQGYTDSYEHSVKHDIMNNNYHLQSYFLMMNYRVLSIYKQHLNKHIDKVIKIIDKNELRHTIIKTFENDIHQLLFDNDIFGLAYHTVEKYLPQNHFLLRTINLSLMDINNEYHLIKTSCIKF